MSGQSFYLIDPNDPDMPFPPLDRASREPNGLLAVGGDLSPSRLLKAYRLGIFPWFDDDQPILWWSPDPRSVIYPGQVKISRSVRKSLRNKGYTFTFNKAFSRVIQACAEPRKQQHGTWITEEMFYAYIHLHDLGFAHSVDVWLNEELVGGLYGIALGKVFFGESMFSKTTDASKCGFAVLDAHLQAWGYKLIDCQVESPHMTTLGAQPIAREAFSNLLQLHCDFEPQQWLCDDYLIKTLKGNS